MESNASDSLLDFGDDSLSPPSAPLGVPEGGATDSPSNGGDPFDPFAGFGEGSFTTSDTLQPTSFSSDIFDPFAVSAEPEPSSKMAATEDQNNYEAQFADLLGDLGDGGGTKAIVNGNIEGESVTTVTKTTTIENDGDVVRRTTITTETEQGEGGQGTVGLKDIWPPQDPAKRVEARLQQKGSTKVQEPSTPTAEAGKEDKKAIDYMKARYEGKEEKQVAKLIREPKKLEHQWEKQVSEDQESADSKDANKQALPREQDLVPYTTLGTDYGRKQYETKVEKEKAAKEGKVLVPVNRQVIEKVAPPEITQSVRAMFETGQLPDIHEVKKTKIDEPPPESGIYENQPEHLQGVVRCTDVNMEGEELKKGMTKDLLNEWSTKGQENGPTEPKGMINVAEDEGKILENEPSFRTDVVRETDDDPTEQIVLQKGHAKNLREKFLKKDDGPKERKAIKLVEDETAPTVFENTPEQLEGVVRATDDLDQTRFERGKAQNLKGYWSSRTDDVDVKREAIKIDRESGPVVLENQPEVLEGVVRATDVPDSEKEIKLDSGRTKNMASMWSRKSEESNTGRKQPIKLDLANAGPSVIENEPVELEGVVKCDTVVEDVIPGNRGRTKDIAGKFLKEEEVDRRPRQMIEIERATGPVVLENEPAPPPEGVVRSDFVNEAATLGSGHTKNLVNRWVDKENEVLSPKTSSGGQGKPKWIQEIEAAKESGVYENNPGVNEGTVKESDIPEDEKQPLIPEEYTRTMRNRWKQMEVDASSTKVKESSELVRFTPPREITPPPVHQQEYQSIQKLTLTPKLQQPQQPQNQQQQQQNGTMQNGQDPTAQQQYYSQQQMSPQGGPPNQTVKSSTVLVLK